MLYLGTCPEMFILRCFSKTDLCIWLMLEGGRDTGIGLYFRVINISLSKNVVKKFKKYMEILSDDSRESSCTYNL